MRAHDRAKSLPKSREMRNQIPFFSRGLPVVDQPFGHPLAGR
jgi:hypothetical protein